MLYVGIGRSADYVHHLLKGILDLFHWQGAEDFAATDQKRQHQCETQTLDCPGHRYSPLKSTEQTQSEGQWRWCYREVS